MDAATKNMTELNYVVSNLAAEEAGGIVWWKLSGDVDVNELTGAWLDAGLDADWLPSPPSMACVLTRGIKELSDKRTLVRPLSGSKGWALVEETPRGDDLDYTILLRAVVDQNDGLTIEPSYGERHDELRAAVRRNYGKLQHSDIGGWFTSLLTKLDAVALRDSGGIYFIPRHSLADWRKIVTVFSAVSQHTVFVVPAMPVDETIDAVLDAVSSEATAEVELMMQQLSLGNLGDRALQSRINKADKIEQKLARYEALLGKRLDGVRGKLTEVRGTAAAAMMMAAPEMTLPGEL